MTRFMRIFLLVPLLLIVLPAPSYCEDDKHLSSVMLLLNSKPLMADIVTKVVTQFGGQVNAALAILLSANQGYSWSQIIDAIEAETLKADGSITGISPQRALSHQKTFSVTRQLESTKYTPEEIKAILLWYEATYKEFITAIARAVCLNYTHNQIITAMKNNQLMTDGFIKCTSYDVQKGLCEYNKDWAYFLVLKPDTKEKTKYWKDCNPIDTSPIIIPKGCWSDGSYWAKIEDASDGYKYTGSDSPGDVGGFYRHSGIIRLKSMGRYEGELKDEPGYCCGNHGDIWLEQPYEDKIRISSIWYDPYGNIIKETDWQDLIRVTCQ